MVAVRTKEEETGEARRAGNGDLVNGGRSRLALPAAIAGFLVSWKLLHDGFYAREVILDTVTYQAYAERVLDGELPYRDFVPEYPPAALPVFLAPAAVAGEGASVDQYTKTFDVLMAAMGVLVIVLMASVLRAVGAGRARIALALGFAAVFPLALGSVMLSRYDLWPALLALGAVAAVLVGRERVGGVALGIAAAAKVYPLVLVPPLALWVARRHSRRRAVHLVAAASATTVAIFAPFLALAPAGVVDSVERQLTPPLQIESLGATILLALDRLIGLDLRIEFSHGSHNVAGTGAAAVAWVQPLLQVAALALTWVLFARGDMSRERLLRYTAASLLAFVAFGNVLSPQHLIWLLPLVPLVAGLRGLVAGAVLGAAAVVTQLWFPFRYAEFTALAPEPAWLALSRNLILVLGFFALLSPSGVARAVAAVAEPARRRFPPARARPALEHALAAVRSAPVQIFFWTRLASWAVVLVAYAWFEPRPPPLATVWDNSLLHDVGHPIDVWARWDSAWYVRIAEDGYDTDPRAPAFFPLYPALVAVLGRMLGGHFLLAGVLLSLAATLAAFVLLYRLAERHIGPAGAWRSVVYLALFPLSLFLQAVYSEALFLTLALAAFLLAERARWPAAACVVGLALLTRSAGVALLLGVAVVAWRSPLRARAFGWLALAPAMFLLYPAFLWWKLDDAFAFVSAQEVGWGRELAPLGPLAGLWEGVRAGTEALGATVAPPPTSDVVRTGLEPFSAAVVNLTNLVFLVLFAGLLVVVWRRLDLSYAVYAAASLALPLSSPALDRWPLLSLPRFGLVVFPFFLALAVIGRTPGRHTFIVAASSLALGFALVQWALFEWVA